MACAPTAAPAYQPAMQSPLPIAATYTPNIVTATVSPTFAYTPTPALPPAIVYLQSKYSTPGQMIFGMFEQEGMTYVPDDVEIYGTDFIAPPQVSLNRKVVDCEDIAIVVAGVMRDKGYGSHVLLLQSESNDPKNNHMVYIFNINGQYGYVGATVRNDEFMIQSKDAQYATLADLVRANKDDYPLSDKYVYYYDIDLDRLGDWIWATGALDLRSAVVGHGSVD